VAFKPRAIREARFARRWLTRGCYRRLRRDAKRATTRHRRLSEARVCTLADPGDWSGAFERALDRALLRATKGWL
jgi:hypothetical protein